MLLTHRMKRVILWYFECVFIARVVYMILAVVRHQGLEMVWQQALEEPPCEHSEWFNGVSRSKQHATETMLTGRTGACTISSNLQGDHALENSSAVKIASDQGHEIDVPVPTRQCSHSVNGVGMNAECLKVASVSSNSVCVDRT